ncbi:MAG TPA: YebC/PmpR family DNA-binding transcriptional regulator [Actinomycetota bacterium]|nr:YebC/PmpR family DNA-binding transcriptional regulator [Actinomycetota bacterium]
MAGHSHWAGIKRKKAVVDARRGKVFAKLIRGIEVAAREGGTSNPENNMTLAAAIERAKEASCPVDTIEKAAKRGAGELDEGLRYERVVYEGYAPGGVALLVETLTENRNRTGSDVRAVFARGGGSIGEPGSVAWMFERKGVVLVRGDAAEDDVLTAAAEGGAEDAHRSGDAWEIVCELKDFGAVRDAVKGAGLPVESADLAMIPTTTMDLDADAARKVLRLVDVLEDLDDVQVVSTNFNVSDEVFAQIS